MYLKQRLLQNCVFFWFTFNWKDFVSGTVLLYITLVPRYFKKGPTGATLCNISDCLTTVLYLKPIQDNSECQL